MWWRPAGVSRLRVNAAERAIVLPRAICAVFIFAFAAIGGPIVFRGAHAGYLLPPTPYSSTDAYLTKIEPNRAFSETLVKLFATFPRESPVFVLHRGEDFDGTFIAQLMAYLAWPHPVQLFDVSQHALPPEPPSSHITEGQALVVACHVPLPPTRNAEVELSSSVAIALPAGAKP